MSVVPEGVAVARDHVQAELVRADVKATTLLSLVGAALAGVVALSGRAMPVAAQVALWSAAVPILAAVLVLLSAIRPRLGDPVPGSWLHAAAVGPSTLLRHQESPGDSAGEAATHVCTLARLAVAKYRRVQSAVTFLVIGLGGLSVALVLSVVAR